jgi:hypothetical protein
MHKLQKIFLGIGMILLLFIPVWIYLIVPELEKMPKDYNFRFEMLSSEDTKYGIGSNWTGETLLIGSIDIYTTSALSDKLFLDGVFHIEFLDGKLSYETPEKHVVDRNSRKKDDGSFFLFPPKLKKQSYLVRFPGWNFPLDVQFENEENIRGLGVYRYKSIVKNANLTESFDFLDLVPDEYSVVTDASGSFYIEPKSGILIKYEESGTNYYFDTKTGKKIQPFSIFSNKFSDDTISNQVRLAQNEKQRIILIEKIIPTLMVLIALALLIAAYIGGSSYKIDG